MSEDLGDRGSVVGIRSRGRVVDRGGGSMVDGAGDGQLGNGSYKLGTVGLIVAHDALRGDSGCRGVVLLRQETGLGDGHQRTKSYQL